MEDDSGHTRKIIAHHDRLLTKRGDVKELADVKEACIAIKCETLLESLATAEICAICESHTLAQ